MHAGKIETSRRLQMTLKALRGRAGITISPVTRALDGESRRESGTAADVGNDTHAGRILRYMQAGHDITPLEALDMFGCFRLGARVWDLRRAGYIIQDAPVKLQNGKTVKKYWIERK